MENLPYRSNVAILIVHQGKVLLLERNNHPDNWQVPQGGIDKNEDLEGAMWRELKEETGLGNKHCKIIARTKDFLSYDIPSEFRNKRTAKNPKFRGQKQIWFLLELVTSDKYIDLNQTSYPEFQNWMWTSYWNPINKIISFKREVYRQALLELLPAAIKLGI